MIKAQILEMPKQNYNLFWTDLLSIISFPNFNEEVWSKNKLVMEFMSTFLMALFMKKFTTGKKILGIGMPCKKGKIEGTFKLDPSFLSNLSIEGLDFDTAILYKEDEILQYMKFQVVRYVFQKETDTSAFFKFLKEKKLSKYQTDDSLFLLILIEDSIRFEFKILNEMLLNTRVPFKNIFAIGRYGKKGSLIFKAIKLFPDVEGPVEVDINKPPPG